LRADHVSEARLTLTRPDNWRLHLRDDVLASVLPDAGLRARPGNGENSTMRNRLLGTSEPGYTRCAKGVKKLLARQFAREDRSTPGPADQGWSAVEDTLKLSVWDKARRVIVLRRAAKTDLALSRKLKRAQGSLPQLGEQIELLMPDKDLQVWEYAVLVTNSSYPLAAFGQLYRDRADCENGFDELKNQWGWGGFTHLVIHKSYDREFQLSGSERWGGQRRNLRVWTWATHGWSGVRCCWQSG
jgi:hypothetical protein